MGEWISLSSPLALEIAKDCPICDMELLNALQDGYDEGLVEEGALHVELHLTEFRRRFEAEDVEPDPDEPYNAREGYYEG